MPITNEDGTVLVDCQGDIILQYRMPRKDDPSVVFSLVQGPRSVGPGGRWTPEDLAGAKGVKPLVSIRVSDVKSVDAIINALKVVRDVLASGPILTPEEAITLAMQEQVAQDIDAEVEFGVVSEDPPVSGYHIKTFGSL